MLYLEDFVELIEQLPAETRDRCMEMRMLDLQNQKSVDQIQKATKELFEQAPSLSRDEQSRRHSKLKEEYKKMKEQTEEKIAITETMRSLFEKYQQRLNKEVLHFKYELEADNPGITEQIEKKVTESERTSYMQRRERRRRGHDSHGSTHTNGNASSANRVDGTNTPTRAHAHKAMVNSASADVTAVAAMQLDNQQGATLQTHDMPMVAASASTHSRSGVSTPRDDDQLSVGSVGASVSAYALGGGGTTPRARASYSAESVLTDQHGLGLGLGLPPVKVTVKRSSINPKQLIAITNVASSPALTSMSPSISDKDHWTSPSASSPAHSPVISKTPHQLHGSTLTTSTSTSAVGALPSGSSMLTFAGQESRHGRPRKLTSRVQEMLKDTIQRHERRMPTGHHSPEHEEVSEEESDHDNDKRTWCICNQKSYGCMVACDNKSCPIEWFHYECVNLTQPPKGKWYCPHCTQAKQRRSLSIDTF